MAVDKERERECVAGRPPAGLGHVAYISGGGLYLKVLGECRWPGPFEPLVGKREAVGGVGEQGNGGGPVGSPVRFSPDGRWIAYGSSATVTSLDGREIVRPLGTELLSWSWIGASDELVGVTDGGGLLLGNPGSSPRRLLPDGWGANSVTTAADGEIAVSRVARDRAGLVNGAASIWTLSVSNSEPVLAYTAPDGTAELKLTQFVPNGNAVVFWVNRFASASAALDGLPLELADLHSSQPAITISTGSPARAADVTTCGNGLAFVAGYNREATREKRLDLASSAESWQSTEPTGAASSAVSPTCSPDGGLVAMASGPNRPWNYGTEDRSIELLSLPSGKRIRLTNPPSGSSDESPTFIDDGRWILFIRTHAHPGGSQGDAYIVSTGPRSTPIGPLFALGPASDYYGSYDWNEIVTIQPSSTAPESVAQLPRCQSSQLSAHPAFAGVGTGNVGQVVTFTNTSSSTCTLYGYPGLQMLDGSGRPIPTQVHRGQSYAVPQLPVRLVTLRPGAPASFEAGYEDGTGFSGVRCPSATTVEITPPGAYRPITIKWALNPYGGDIERLRCGRVSVSPVYAGTAGAYETSE